MKGEVVHEAEFGFPASKVWEIYGSIRLARLVVKSLPDLFAKVELVEGDGGVGSVLLVTFSSGLDYKEKFVIMDNEKRMKLVEGIGGGFLAASGLKKYVVRMEVIEKGEDVSVARTTVEYEIDESSGASASSMNTDTFVAIAEAVKKHLSHGGEEGN
ncbi:hypothetical protein QJS10_CPA10g01190 [Acorus calamus]|uniref:Bet v I/Major latex protein domain-containing protein n=1 Tax=Acorus calamus TaxID=4465 RepID=A0AAV9E2A4_ACOCL|nr:hypothetical protein QJS10_CPA10g01190 [Acorus calamus]